MKEVAGLLALNDCIGLLLNEGFGLLLNGEELLKFVAVCCSCRVERVGLLGVEVMLGRLKEEAKGLLEPVGVGIMGCCCWLLVAHGLFVLFGITG